MDGENSEVEFVGFDVDVRSPNSNYSNPSPYRSEGFALS